MPRCIAARRDGNGTGCDRHVGDARIYHHVARFARVRDAGFTVWMPHLFGTIGTLPTPDQFRFTMARACISREFRAFAADSSSPITVWLRALAAHARSECGGRGVGAIGIASPATSRCR